MSRKYNIWTIIITVLSAELIFWLLMVALWEYVKKNEPSFRFEHTWVLYSAAIVFPIVVLSGIYLPIWKNKAIERYAESDLLQNIFTGYSNWKTALKYFSIRLAAGFFIIAAANPQYGSIEREFETKGIDIMIALDVSKSMLAEDLVKDKSRMYVAKKGVNQFIDNLHGDHIGSVIFAGSAYKHLPITSDYEIAKTFIKNVNTDMLSSQGTNIGLAIETCMSAFDFERATNKVIVIFSDGEDHEQQAVLAAKEAAEKGVIIHTIGMGGKEGKPIPLPGGGFKSDASGKTVITKLNENMMIEIATAGNGIYTRAQGYNIGLDGLINQINKVEKTATNKDKFLTYDDHFQVFLLIGILLFITFLALSENKSRSFSLLKTENHV